MPSFTKQDNPANAMRIRKCADKFCGLFFCPTEDIRQLYCSKSCKKRVQNRKRETKLNNQKEKIMNYESYASPTPVPQEHTALRYLRESLAWTDRQIDDGVREVERKMDELARQIKDNNQLLQKKKEILDAIKLLETSL